MYRLVVDASLGPNREEAKRLAQEFLDKLKVLAGEFPNNEFSGLQYRLSNDNDRTSKNHMVENENGHAPTSKAKLFG